MRDPPLCRKRSFRLSGRELFLCVLKTRLPASFIEYFHPTLQELIARRGALFAVLLDPDTSDSGALLQAGRLAVENGADVLLVGGSFMGNPQLPKQILELKAALSVPVILFPGGASQVVPGFDAFLFTTLVSGRNPRCS